MEFAYSLESYPGVRKGILEGILKFLAWLRTLPIDKWKESGCFPDPHWSAIFPTRYGKSDFSRTAALIAQAQGLAGPALVVHPGIPLAEQYLESDRLATWKRRWNIHCSRPVVTLHDFGWRPFQNNEWLGSIHIQALVRKEELVKQFAETLAAKHSLPPIMFVDETHRYTIQNRWGDIPRAWEAGGGITVPLTATAFRHDGDDLYGFEKTLDTDKGIGGIEEFERTYAKRHPDPKKIWVCTDIGERNYYKLAADHEVTFPEAWNQVALARCTVDWIDVDMREVPAVAQTLPGELQSLKLSEMPKSKAIDCLTTVCRDPQVIHEFTRRVVQQLRTFRAHESTSDATAIVYGLSDLAGMGDDSHLTAIRDAFLAIDSSLVVKIATLKADGRTNREDEKAQQLIKQFTDPKRKTIDIIILKMMGGEGLDSDRIKVVGTIDSARSAGGKIQQWNRGGNIWGQCRHFVIVTLKDCLSVQIYDKLIAAQGGEATEEEVYESWQEEKDKQPQPEYPLFEVVSAEQSGAADNDGLSCTATEYSRATRLLGELPGLIHNMSIPEIAAKAVRLGVQPTEDFQDPGNTSDRTTTIISQLNEMVKHGAKILFQLEHKRKPDLSKKEDRDEYGGRFKREFIGRVKAAACVEGSWDQSDSNRIRDLDVLRRLLNVAEQIVRRLTSEVT